VAVRRMRLRAPSGARVDIGLPADAPVSSVAAAVRFGGGSYGTGFGIGPRGYHDFAARHVAPATLRERLVVQGREVLVAEADDGESSWATLLGTHHELMTVYAGPAPGRDRIAALFGSLRITDQADGLTVAPRAATLLDTLSEQLMLTVRGRGAVCVPGRRQARALIPAYAGAAATYGEFWKAPYPGGSGRHAFVLGCPAGAAEVHLATSAAVPEREYLEWLDGISVSWID
jgi:hypothetical protein